jgi:ATP-binding cassette subfamily B protein
MNAEPFHDDEFKGSLDLGLWRRIFAHARPYRRELLGLSGAGMVLALVDTFFPFVTGRLIDEATEHGLTEALAWWGVGYLALSVVLAACVWIFIVLAGRTATGLARDLRRKGFRRLQELSFSFFDVRPVGWLVTRLTSDCSKVSSLVPWFMLDFVWGNSLIVMIIVAMLLLNAKLALAVMAIVPPLALVSVFFQRRLLDSSRHVRRTNSQLTASFNECIMGVRTTKSLVREDANLTEFQEQTGAMERYSMRNALQSAVYLPLIIVLGSVGVGLALWRGGASVMFGEDVTVGTLIAFMQYAAFFFMPVQELARRFTEVQSAQAAAERIQGLLETEPEIHDSPAVVATLRARADDPVEDGLAEDGHDPVIHDVALRNVSYWYKEGELVLDDVSLIARAGETIALVGPTGGGKSTIVSLVARFYEPQQGAVLVNGVDTRERGLHWLQSNLGVVLQVPHLFSGTIRENIRYGRLDASDAEVEAAAKVSNAHAFIEELDDGYETEVGETGTRLSTGQRQLVALARAVLADPQIFIMDEATSSVDTETERLIQDGIDSVLRGRIAFVIAHRLSTIRSADRIVVIDGGRIVEQGTHESLLEQHGRYHALYTRQFTEERSGHVLAGSEGS